MNLHGGSQKGRSGSRAKVLEYLRGEFSFHIPNPNAEEKKIIEKAIVDIEEEAAEGQVDISETRAVCKYTLLVKSAANRISPRMVESLASGMSIQDILKMPLEEFNAEIRKEKESTKQRTQASHSASVAIYMCPKCKQRDHTFEMRQLRSIDEGATAICTCNQCGHVWHVSS